MAEYKHGIETTRDSNVEPEVEKASIAQAVIGTAPINLLDDPAAAVNKVIIINKKEDIAEKIGRCADYDNYTLMQASLVSIEKFGVAPVVMINVLDPKNERHVTAVAATEVTLDKGCTKIEKPGILLDTVIVSDATDDSTGERGEDYEIAFDADGYVDVAMSKTGKFAAKDKVKIAYTKLKPEGVTEADIIGGTDENGVRTGADLLDEIYMMHNIIPSYIGAPKYSMYPAVAAVLEAKAEAIGDKFNVQVFCDMESTEANTPEKIKEAKDKLGVYGRQTVLAWPTFAIVGGKNVYASCVKMALMQYEQQKNSGVPRSIDNVNAKIEGIALQDGTSKLYTEKQMNNYALAYGVSTFIYCNGWKSWGDTTAAYPDSDEPNVRSIKSVAVGNWMENKFKTEYSTEIGRDLSPANVKSVVENYNFELTGLTPQYLAGGKIIFDADENPESEILKGNLVFHTMYADYPTQKYMNNRFTWDKSYISQAMSEVTGGEE